MVNVEALSFLSDSLYEYLELTFWSSRPEVTSNRASLWTANSCSFLFLVSGGLVLNLLLKGERREKLEVAETVPFVHGAADHWSCRVSDFLPAVL